MTKMAAMTIYGKKKTFENLLLRIRNLICSVRESGSTTFCSSDDPWLTLTYFTPACASDSVLLSSFTLKLLG